MSLFDKVGKFETQVKKLPQEKVLPLAIQRTQKLAAKFDAKLKKLAQTSSGAIDASIDATRKALENFFQTVRMSDKTRSAATQYYDMLAGLKNPDANDLSQLMEITKSLGPLVSGAGGANAVLPALSKLYQEAKAQQQQLASTPQPGQEAPQQAPASQQTARNFPSIPVSVQNALSNLMVAMNVGAPLRKADGVLGPETQAAIDAFKKHMGPAVANLSGKALFDRILSDSKRANDLRDRGQSSKEIASSLQQVSAPDLTDAARQREELPKQQGNPFGNG